MPSPDSDMPRGYRPFWIALLASALGASGVILIIVAALVFTGSTFDRALVSGEKTQADRSGLPQQTEVLFLNGLKTQPASTDEWWAARSDHRLIAYAVFSCKQQRPPNVTLDSMPRQWFSGLLLDLTPSGNHVFQTKEGDDFLIAARDKTVEALELTSADRDLLSLSDSIARARLAAADGANTNVPWVQRLGLATLIIAALATLFVTLQGKMKPVELTEDEKKQLDHDSLPARLRYTLWGPGSGFKWVAFLAITLSITGTSLTGLKQVYDPTRILTQNTRALLELRQLHQDVILGVQCDGNGTATNPGTAKWKRAIHRIQATIIPDYGAFAALDVGGSQRPDQTQNQPQDGEGDLDSGQRHNAPPAQRAPVPAAQAAPK